MLNNCQQVLDLWITAHCIHWNMIAYKISSWMYDMVLRISFKIRPFLVQSFKVWNLQEYSRISEPLKDLKCQGQLLSGSTVIIQHISSTCVSKASELIGKIGKCCCFGEPNKSSYASTCLQRPLAASSSQDLPQSASNRLQLPPAVTRWIEIKTAFTLCSTIF